MSEMKHKIIGITGRKFSGKDTLGSYFVNRHGFEQIAYAGALKDAVKCIFDFDDEQLHGSKKEVVDEFWNKTPREVLQFVGTDLFREHWNKDIWVSVVKRKILNRPNTKFIITDIRFPNEAELVKELGGIVIKLQRETGCIDNHESEKLIDDLQADYVFDNDCSKDELYQKVMAKLANM